ncbi:MAG: Cyclic di-GMP phosphodiesterase Gmr [Syntrophus sp. PtaU1.Bin208]|nr:MAG: Cyclic di-GMP phosphodiesterase Gmr [Syntrophus sp. PtaU1.Bin208]
MKDEEKTREQLLEELMFLRSQLDEQHKKHRGEVPSSATSSDQPAEKNADAKFRILFEHSPEGIFLSDGFLLTDCNETMVKMMRCSAKEELIGRHPYAFSPPAQPDGSLSSDKADQLMKEVLRKGYSQQEWLCRRCDGEEFPVEILSSVISWEDQQILYMVWRDITERKRIEEAIRHLAYHDILTGLPNRMLFADRLVLAIAQAKRRLGTMAVMMLDLDGFKTVNDVFGHHIGDLLLQSVGERLTRNLREEDTLARMGGDEFMILLPVIKEAANSCQIADKILSAFKTPFSCEGNELYTSVSIGIAVYPEDGDDMDSLMKHADSAMYRAKGRGRNRYCLYGSNTALSQDSSLQSI